LSRKKWEFSGIPNSKMKGLGASPGKLAGIFV
jgi:hypothetical protein